jgi:hypothetical protein
MGKYSYRFKSRFSNLGVIAAVSCAVSLITFFILAIMGWVFNIVTICHLTTFSGMAVMRVIGIFIAPIGAVLGWF